MPDSIASVRCLSAAIFGFAIGLVFLRNTGGGQPVAEPIDMAALSKALASRQGVRAALSSQFPLRQPFAGGNPLKHATGYVPMDRAQQAEMRALLQAAKAGDDGDFMTLSRYMMMEAKKKPEMYGDLESLMTSIQMACKQIASLVSRSGIQDLTGLEEGGGSVNVQGEEQKKLDVISNTVLKNALRFSGKVGVVGSEEEDAPVLVEEAYSGKYVTVFDPLDGSSNIDAAISTGTIFGIFEAGEPGECTIENEKDLSDAEVKCLVDTLQPGKKLVAAGYCMYSSSTIMVLTTGEGVNGFTLDPNIGEFVLTHPNIKIPSRGKIYSINEANYFDWDPALQEYVNNLKAGKGESGAKYSARYIGSMVGDVHRTLLYGGIFGYPGDAKNPNGKLRLLYEGAPMSFLLEQAGGKSTTGSQRVMEIVPGKVHQRVPVFLGSPEDIDEVSKVYAAAGIEKNY
jgi:fructose-1,6-bisphosphatase I